MTHAPSSYPLAVVAILFTGRYPRAIFDKYPPFRLDIGGREPAPETTTPDVTNPNPALGRS